MILFGETVMTEGPNEKDIAELEALILQFEVKLPKHWDTYKWEQKVEFVAHRMLLAGRTSTKHTVMKEEGWLSDYQLERRRRREVLSKFGSWDEIPPKKGNFKRAYNPESNET